MFVQLQFDQEARRAFKIKEIHPFCLSFLGLCYFWNRLYSNNYVRIVSKDERSDKAHVSRMNSTKKFGAP